MENDNISIEETPPGPFKTRIEALQVRVNRAALALHERNVRPTVQRIRTALGGGSPNDLAPALKRWREEVLPTLKTADDTPVGVPPLIADIVRELWTRALAAAAVEAVGGAKARRAIAQTEEVATLRGEIERLRDQIEREQQLVGDLRSQRARSESQTKIAIQRMEDAEKRERRAQLRIGSLLAQTSMADRKANGKPKTNKRVPLPGQKTAARAASVTRHVAPPTKATAKPGRRASVRGGGTFKAGRKKKTGRHRG